MGDPEKNNNDMRFVAQPDELQIRADGKTEGAVERIKNRRQQEIIEAYEKYMPLGSVVRLEDFKKNMIIGYNSDDGKDYICCAFPFGVTHESGLISIDHEDIKGVHDIGYLSRESVEYRRELKK